MRAEVVFDDLLRQVDLLLDDEHGPEQADVVADLLGFLAERMTKLHEARQEEMASFLEWLEETIGCPVDDLSGKTYVRAYDEQDDGVDRLLEVLENNHPSKVSIDVAKPREYGGENLDRQRVVRGYERSMETLEPIRKQIELTDELIDRIVYRLYRLTPEEIEIVESST